MIGEKAIEDLVAHQTFAEEGLVTGSVAFGGLDHRQQ